MTRALVSAVLMVGLATSVAAQSTLSVQGLGYPPGQLSTHAKTMGGSTGEIDAASPLNPASILLIGSAIIMMQAEPEYRTLRVGTQKQKTSVSRFPVFMGAVPLGPRWALALSASTLLDRTWSTTTRDSQIINVDTVRFRRDEFSDGSITDLRFAVAFAANARLRFGLAAHGLSGRDLLRSDMIFDDVARFDTLVQQTTISFGGSAVSGGAQFVVPRVASIGASYRVGGALRVYEGNTVVGRGNAPDHYGVSLAYLGITGTTLAVRAAKDKWSNLVGTAPTLTIHEGWDIGVGGDIAGPSFGSAAISGRFGARWRTLPFSATATPVKEQTWGGGLGIPIARGDVQLNLGVLRASRTSDAGTSEKAWTLSTGFAIRP
jgi:hypothetical protein